MRRVNPALSALGMAQNGPLKRHKETPDMRDCENLVDLITEHLKGAGVFREGVTGLDGADKDDCIALVNGWVNVTDLAAKIVKSQKSK